MPGSKTYTSYKANELLESEFLDTLQSLKRNRFWDISNIIVSEILKISLSILISAIVNYMITPPEIIHNILPKELSTIAVFIFLFIIIYLLMYFVLVMIRLILDTLFNKRRRQTIKNAAYETFHKRILNHIYLAISFENKYIVYLSKQHNSIDDLNFDLAINYLSQAVHYFKLSKISLNKLIPPLVKNTGYRERKNAEFLGHIGYSILSISLVSGQRSLNRLYNTKSKILNSVSNISSTSNNSTIRLNYTTSINMLFSEINDCISQFNQHLVRTTKLHNDFQNSIKNA